MNQKDIEKMANKAAKDAIYQAISRGAEDHAKESLSRVVKDQFKELKPKFEKEAQAFLKSEMKAALRRARGALTIYLEA